jgi:hypothetical protein
MVVLIYIPPITLIIVDPFFINVRIVNNHIWG